MQNLKKNWLVLWKITWGILEIFTRALENWDSKLGLLWGTSITSRKCISLKVSGELCVMTMKKMQNLKRNWLVQNWHEEFNKFWPKHSKISKICTLMGCFWPKYIMLQLREYREAMFDDTQDWLKILKENWFVVSKMTRIWWILIRALKSPKNLHFDWSFPVIFDLKKCRGVVFYDTKEWCKIWRKNNFWFGK